MKNVNLHEPIIPTRDEYEMSGWEPPIKLICQEISNQIEDSVITTIQRIGVDVDLEELIKALAYDRNQYNRGYTNGFADGFAAATKGMEVPQT